MCYSNSFLPHFCQHNIGILLFWCYCIKHTRLKLHKLNVFATHGLLFNLACTQNALFYKILVDLMVNFLLILHFQEIGKLHIDKYAISYRPNYHRVPKKKFLNKMIANIVHISRFHLSIKRELCPICSLINLIIRSQIRTIVA